MMLHAPLGVAGGVVSVGAHHKVTMCESDIHQNTSPRQRSDEAPDSNADACRMQRTLHPRTSPRGAKWQDSHRCHCKHSYLAVIASSAMPTNAYFDIACTATITPVPDFLIGKLPSNVSIEVANGSELRS